MLAVSVCCVFEGMWKNQYNLNLPKSVRSRLPAVGFIHTTEALLGITNTINNSRSSLLLHSAGVYNDNQVHTIYILNYTANKNKEEDLKRELLSKVTQHGQLMYDRGIRYI